MIIQTTAASAIAKSATVSKISSVQHDRNQKEGRPIKTVFLISQTTLC